MEKSVERTTSLRSSDFRWILVSKYIKKLCKQIFSIGCSIEITIQVLLSKGQALTLKYFKLVLNNILIFFPNHGVIMLIYRINKEKVVEFSYHN